MRGVTEKQISRNGVLQEERLALAQIRNLKLADFQEYWKVHQDICKRVENSNHYHYLLDGETNFDECPHIGPFTLATFYNNTHRHSVNFIKAQNFLFTRGRAVANKNLELDDLIQTGKVFLDNSYILINSFLALNAARATPPDYYNAMSEMQRIPIKKFIEEIGVEKSENFRETLRRYIPRWLHQPILLPESLQGKQQFESKDIDFLIHPTSLIEGVPLHLALKIAQDIEAKQNPDLGYFLRTYALTQTLRMEKERFSGETTKEIPYFWYIFADLIAADNRDFSYHFFNFRTVVNETMQMTFERLGRENNSESLAVVFLDQLAKFYPDHFPQLITRSILNHSNLNEKIDQIAVFAHLQSLNLEWSNKLLTSVDNLTNRRLITAKEIDTSAVFFSEQLKDDSVTEGGVGQQIMQIAGEEDNYSFRVVGPKIGVNLEEEKAKLEVEVELDTNLKRINSVVTFRSGQFQRFLPVTLSFSGERSSMTISCLEGSGISEQTYLAYRNLILKSINFEYSRNLKQEQEKKGAETTIEKTYQSTAPSTRLSREERITLYYSQDSTTEEAAKKRRHFESSKDLKTEVLGQAEAEQLEPKIKITGLEIDRVEKLLRDGRVLDVKPEEVVRRLSRALIVAQSDGFMVGKKLTRDYCGTPDVDFRQLNWKLLGQSIRVYLQGIGSDQYLLRGIMHKQSSTNHVKFVRQLVQQALREG